MTRLAGRCGIPRDDERVYVGVNADVEPLMDGSGRTALRAVVWPDGRRFPVTGTYGRMAFGRRFMGNYVERWDVEVCGRRSSVWREGERFFVRKPGAGSVGFAPGP